MSNRTLTPENLAALEGREKAARGRNTLLIGGLAAIALVEAVTIMQMLPLKERVPYFVEVERATGRVVQSDQAARSFVPDENNRRYFVKEWVQSMFMIDQARTKEYLLPRARAMVRGKAINQYENWLNEDKTILRMVESPDLSRAVEVRSISFLPGAENVAMVRVLFHTEDKNTPKVTEGRVVTIHYEMVPPQTDEEILRNPIGLLITEFNVDSEVIK